MEKYTPLKKFYARVGFITIITLVIYTFYKIITFDFCTIYYGIECLS